MIISFRDLDGKVQRVTAKIKIRHSSPHGQPVLISSDGETVDVKSWTDLGYLVISATTEERYRLEKIGLT
jgi:hypothetical protein